MIDKKDFYENDDEILIYQKQKIWSLISKEITPRKGRSYSWFDIKSFSFGLAAAIILLFAGIGVYSTFSNWSFNQKPELVKLNKVYEHAISTFERKLPVNNTFTTASIHVDEAFAENQNELKILDAEIITINQQKNYSRLKQLRLNELYKMKLDILSKMIKLKEEEL